MELTTTTTTNQVKKPINLHRCRFPDWSPTIITSLNLIPNSFNLNYLNFSNESNGEGRNLLAVGRANGNVELMCWGNHQGWITWRTLPSSFPLPSTYSPSQKKPTSLLSHLLFTHQTTLSPSDVELYSNDLEGATREIKRLEREGVRLFGVGGLGSELIEWEWGGPGAKKEVGRIKSTLPTLPPIFSLAASRSSSFLAIGCEDSTIRILNILDSELEIISKIDLQFSSPGKVRALSLVWGAPIAAKSIESVSKGKGRESSPSEASIIPLSFQTPSESALFAGLSNSTIQSFSPPSSFPSTSSLSSNQQWKSTAKLLLDKLKGTQTLVWSLALLADGGLVSGDSLGNVVFWDMQKGVQGKSFKGHRSDVLCLVVGSDGTSVFTSGVDQKTIEFRLVPISQSSSNKSSSISGSKTTRWIQSSGRRLHSHDVRSMVISPIFNIPLPTGYAPTVNKKAKEIVPILTSGGLDLSLITVCCSTSSNTTILNTPSKSGTQESISIKNPVSETLSVNFESTTHRRASYIPQRSKPFFTTSSSSNSSNSNTSRLLLCRRDRGIGIWKLSDPKSKFGSAAGLSGEGRERDGGWGSRGINREEEIVEGEVGWEKVLELDLKLQTNLISSTVSSDGKWLAVSDLYETKLFKLSYKNQILTPSRQKSFSTFLSSHLPSSLGTGSSNLIFSPDCKRLILSTSFGATIAVVELPLTSGEEFKLVGLFSEHGTRGVGIGGREIKGMKKGNKGEDVEMNGNDSEEEVDSEDEEDEDVEMNHILGLNNGSGNNNDGNGAATIVLLGISSDGNWLASADLERKVCIFNLNSLRHHTTLPSPTSVPTALTFLPLTKSSPTPILLIALPTNSISLFNLNSNQFEPWSLILSSLKGNTLMDLREPVVGVEFEPRDVPSSLSNGTNEDSVMTNGTKGIHSSRLNQISTTSSNVNESLTAIIYGSNWVARIDLDQVKNGGISSLGGKNLKSKAGKNVVVRREADKKRAREEEIGFVPSITSDTSDSNVIIPDIKITRKYQPLVLLDFTAPGELVVVEKTWFDLSKDLPEPWIRSGEFGT